MLHLSSNVGNLIESVVNVCVCVGRLFLGFFFCFFLSLGSSFRALTISAEAEGARLSVLKGQFHCSPQTLQSLVALAMSSPNVFRDRPRGLILDTRADMKPTLPLEYLIYITDLSAVELQWCGGGS